MRVSGTNGSGGAVGVSMSARRLTARSERENSSPSEGTQYVAVVELGGRGLRAVCEGSERARSVSERARAVSGGEGRSRYIKL